MEICKRGFISSAAHTSTCLPLVTWKGTFFRIGKQYFADKTGRKLFELMMRDERLSLDWSTVMFNYEIGRLVMMLVWGSSY